MLGHPNALGLSGPDRLEGWKQLPAATSLTPARPVRPLFGAAPGVEARRFRPAGLRSTRKPTFTVGSAKGTLRSRRGRRSVRSWMAFGSFGHDQAPGSQGVALSRLKSEGVSEASGSVRRSTPVESARRRRARSESAVLPQVQRVALGTVSRCRFTGTEERRILSNFSVCLRRASAHRCAGWAPGFPVQGPREGRQPTVDDPQGLRAERPRLQTAPGR